MKKKASFFFEREFDGMTLANEGDVVKGRVVAVARQGVVVEAAGVEAFIGNPEASCKYILDARSAFRIGDEVDVKLVEVYKNDDDSFDAVLSIKEVEREAYERALSLITPDRRYVGEVTAVNSTGVFVRIQPGDIPVDVLCATPKFGYQPYPGGNVTIKVTHRDVKGLFGLLQHISAEK